MTFSSSDTHSFLKKLAMGIGLTALIAILTLPFFGGEWLLPVYLLTIFIGINALFLYLFATSHEEVPIGPQVKRALFYYSVTDLFPGLFFTPHLSPYSSNSISNLFR